MVIDYWLLVIRDSRKLRTNSTPSTVSSCSTKKNSINTIIPLSFVVLLLGFVSCDLVNPEEQIPAYLQIDSFEFTTTPAQGTNAEQITDAWVFVNDISLGIYELPATVPVLDLGNHKIEIAPVIRENAEPSTPIMYPFFERYETTMELKASETVSIQPTTRYSSNAVFELVEDFNSTNHRLKGGNTGAVQVNNGEGQILLGDNESIEFTSSATFQDLPTSGGFPVFLEIDYQTNVELALGLVGIDPNPVNPINATSYKIILNPTANNWNRVYINFREDLEFSQLPSYKLAFRVARGETGTSVADPKTLIDNVKFIRLKN